MPSKFKITLPDLFDKFKYDATAAMDHLLASPSRLMRFLRHDVARSQLDVRTRLVSVSPEDPNPGVATSSLGLTPIGEWFEFGKTATMLTNSRMVISWPHVISGAADLFHVCASAPLLVLSVNHIISRKSPVVSELLRRHIKTQYLESARVHLGDTVMYNAHTAPNAPLTQAELEILRVRLSVISLDKKLIVAIKNSFNATYGRLVPKDPSLYLKKALPNLDTVTRRNCSLLYVDRIVPVTLKTVSTRFKLPQATTTKSFDDSFTLESYPGLLGELSYIVDFAKYQWGGKKEYAEFRHKHGVGIQKDRETRSVDKYLYIHWKTWLEHRQQFSKTLLSSLPLTKAEKYSVASGKLPHYSVVVTHIYNVFRTSGLYDEIYAEPSGFIGTWDLELHKHYGAIFGLHAPPKPHEFCVVDIPKLRHALIMYRIRSERSSPRHSSVGSYKKSGKAKEFITARYLYPEHSDDQYEFLFTHRRSGMYFSPPWHSVLDNVEDIKDNAPGVVKDNVTQRRYYTLKCLQENALYAAQHPLFDTLNHVWSFLSNYAHMDKKTFMKNRNSMLKLFKGRWSPEQTEAVATLWRPDITDTSLKLLYDICSNRTRDSVAKQAKQIRGELLRRGVFDLKLLPHRNFTERLSQEIREAKRLYDNNIKKEENNE